MTILSAQIVPVYLKPFGLSKALPVAHHISAAHRLMNSGGTGSLVRRERLH